MKDYTISTSDHSAEPLIYLVFGTRRPKNGVGDTTTIMQPPWEIYAFDPCQNTFAQADYEDGRLVFATPNSDVLGKLRKWVFERGILKATSPSSVVSLDEVIRLSIV
ncbi:MAG TPA: hypothetical protein VJH37_05305 [Candidatus Nanoarchaeia archaeon]|nr:hypothetical protein [Candidatus Nanoarchaeia archaeon]